MSKKKQPKYKRSTGIQFGFDCAMELLYCERQKTDKEVEIRLLDIVNQME